MAGTPWCTLARQHSLNPLKTKRNCGTKLEKTRRIRENCPSGTIRFEEENIPVLLSPSLAYSAFPLFVFHRFQTDRVEATRIALGPNVLCIKTREMERGKTRDRKIASRFDTPFFFIHFFSLSLPPSLFLFLSLPTSTINQPLFARLFTHHTKVFHLFFPPSLSSFLQEL